MNLRKHLDPMAVAALMILDIYWENPKRGEHAYLWIAPAIEALPKDISRVDLAYAVVSALNAFETLESLEFSENI